jgi:hypothetical protein
MQYALDALQIEEYLAKYVLSFRRSWLREYRAKGLIQDILLTAQLRRAVGIETDSDELIRKVKIGFVDRITEQTKER